MNDALVQTIITGVFALVSLGGALLMEMQGVDTPEWLIATIGAAVGFLFGNVKKNGFNGRKLQ